MTQQDPFEAQTATFQTGQSSILGPTLVTALVAALLFAVPSIVRGIDPGMSCCWNCTAGIFVWFLGALPAWMLWNKQGARFSGGHAFAAAFLGVGCGSAVGVILQTVAPGLDEAKLREWTERIMEESRRQGQPLPIEEAEFREALESMCLTAPIVTALVGSIVAGFVGMLTLSLLNRRRPPSQPVNAWSDPGA